MRRATRRMRNQGWDNRDRNVSKISRRSRSLLSLCLKLFQMLRENWKESPFSKLKYACERGFHHKSAKNDHTTKRITFLSF